MKSAILLGLVAMTASTSGLRAAEQRPGPLPSYGCSAILLGLIAITASTSALHAAEQRPGPLPGYGCMMLKQTEAEAMDPNSPPVWIMTAPRPDAPRGTTAGMVVIAKAPTHTENGYVEVLQINGAPGWIPERAVVPFRSASNPYARCEPTIASNGRVGFR